MAVSVAAVMRHINNYFEVGCIFGGFAISGNAIAPVPESPWCFVKGSWMHDGVHKVIGPGMLDISGFHADEEFEGRVWLLKPPAEFLALCELISAYDDANPVGALQAEKFGGYSKTRFANAPHSWQGAFEAHLAPYRRMFTEVG